MIRYGNAKFSYANIGHFLTDKEWIHPSINQKTHQIIFVASGDVYIVEKDQEYHLTRGDTLFLEANETHYGFRYSNGLTSFYWMHFMLNDFSCFPNFPKTLNNFQDFLSLKELLHRSLTPDSSIFQKDILCANILLKLCNANADNDSIPKIAHEIFEWIRINANAKLSVSHVAGFFKYTPEYIGRITKKYYDIAPKELINRFVVSQANNLLSNSNYSVKEISSILEFDSPNSFVKFYKYHAGVTPTEYKNIYPRTEYNNDKENIADGLLIIKSEQVLKSQKTQEHKKD